MVCLAHGHTSVASSDVAASGEFELIAEECEPGVYYAVVLADGREAVRRRIDVDDDLTIDVGEVVLVPVEWSAGMHGQLWDEAAQSPVGPGMVTLTTDDGERVAQVPTDPDGAFTVRMSCGRPLPPGAYLLEVDAAKYAPGRLLVRVVEERTVTELGRIHLDALTATVDEMT